jgi:hypothetical protein
MARITATFSIWSKLILPEKISTVLSATPDRTVLRGVDRSPPRKLPDAYGWHLTCRDERTDDVEKTLVGLLDRVSGFDKQLPTLAAMDKDLDLRVSLSITPFEEALSFFFSSNTLDNLARLNSSFDIDFFSQPD